MKSSWKLAFVTALTVILNIHAKYMVIDLSGGTNTTSYPVTYLDSAPAGGWTDEHKTTKLVMRTIPAGTFIMGSSTDELGRYADENSHTVTLTQPYYLGVFEITQRQWELVMGNKPSGFSNTLYYATRPVETVSYYDARENPANSDDPAVNWPENNSVTANSFMGKLRDKTGMRTFDLPTEAQWEYACRAGTTTSLNSGYNITNLNVDANLAETARYLLNGGDVGQTNSMCSTNGGTAKVGSYMPNAWGLYDMHGNVWEWCLDWYGAYPGTVTDPSGLTSGIYRVPRGGCWDNGARYNRSSFRSGQITNVFLKTPNWRHYGTGCRVALTAPLVTVTFDAQGGTVSPGSATVTNYMRYGILPTPIREGHRSAGWWTGIGGTGTRVTESTIVNAESGYTLYVRWEADFFSVGHTNAVNSSSENSGDGGTSVNLGGVGLLADGQMAGIEWSVTGPGILVYDWKVSSEADYDWLRFYEAWNGPTNQISGNVDWSRWSVTVLGATDLPHTFRWEYEKDPVGDYVGQDSGWVDAISWTPLYTVTVNNGSSDGYYTNNAYASIIADAAAVHYEFDRWTGETNTVANIFAASTTMRMPNTNATVTATYKPILYTLSAANASGGGSYPYATTVEIRASVFGNKRFYRWTGDVASVSDVNAATTTVVTTDHTISVTATYSVPLAVNSGSGSGWYPEGSIANVSADSDPMWKEFVVWTGDVGLLSNANARTTTLTLPTGPATVTATYKDSISRLTGSYGHTYSESGTAGAITPDAGAGSPSGTPAVKLGGAGVIPDNGFSVFETVVSGTGSILFQWKVSSESNGDYLKFKVDGVEVTAITGTKVPWTQVSNRVDTAGSHTLRWEYVKNGSVASSTDAGWVDDIVWMGDVPEPKVVPVIVQAALTNLNMAIQFMGERGIAYVVQTNGTLNPFGWGDYQSLLPTWINESNGVHRFEIAPPESASGTLFYRIATLDPFLYLVIDLSAGTNALSYTVSYLNSMPVGGWTDEYKTTKLVMRKINKGTFTMGSPEDELGREADEVQHEVTLTKDFYMGVFEVTQRQWELVMGNRPSGFNNATYYATRPVEGVSYYNIREDPANSAISPNWPQSTQVHGNSFMGKLRVKTGMSTFDLPTESQWEYACRAGTATALNSGYDLSNENSDPRVDEVGRYRYNGGFVNGTIHPPFNCTTENGTAKVGSYIPNPCGLYDMHGNVWEFCLDWFGSYQGVASNPEGSSTGEYRIPRGGSYYFWSKECRSGSRGILTPSFISSAYGFRAAMTLP